jgi:hypothetical protein
MINIHGDNSANAVMKQVRMLLDSASDSTEMAESDIIHIVFNTDDANDIVRRLPQRYSGTIVGDKSYGTIPPTFSPTIGRMTDDVDFTVPLYPTLYLAEQWYQAHNQNMDWTVPEDLMDTLVYPGDYVYLSEYRKDYINTVAKAAGLTVNHSRRRLFGSPVAIFPLLGEVDIPDSLLLDTLETGAHTIVIAPDKTLPRYLPQVSFDRDKYHNLHIIEDNLNEVIHTVEQCITNVKVYNGIITYIGDTPSGNWGVQVGDIDGFPA